MTTKKARRKKEATNSAPVEDDPPRIVDGQKHMTKLDLARFLLADTKLLSIRQAREIKDREKRDVLVAFDNKIAELLMSERQAKAEMVKLREELGGKYEVNFFDPALGFDDQTGRLVFAPSPVREERNDAEKASKKGG